MAYSSLNPTQNTGNFLSFAILSSILLHLLGVFFYLNSLSNVVPVRPINEIYQVELIPAPEKQSKNKKQIVDTAVMQEQVPNQLPAFEAEKDNFTVQQQIRRGDDNTSAGIKNSNVSKAIEQQVARPEKEVPKTSAETKTEKTEKLSNKISAPLNLKLDQAEMQLKPKAKESAEEMAQRNIQQALSNPAQAPLGSGVDVSRLGSRDYLSDIPDGDITLLNAKANKFAVFVRRVASQVFANLKSSGWQSLGAGDIKSIDQAAVFEAILNRQGQLLSVKRINQSGSNKFDLVLEGSIKKGAKDPNPPEGAQAADGLIHFTFEAKSWVEFRANRRTGNPTQVRWLLLGTGLD